MSIVSFMLPVVKHFTSTLVTAEDASKAIVSLSIGSENKGATGYFEGAKQSTSSDDSQDEVKQAQLLAKCVEWAKFGRTETMLKL